MDIGNENELTVNITLPRDGVPYTRYDLIEALESSGLKRRDIRALGTLSLNLQWMLTLANQSAVTSCIQNPPKV